MDYNSDPQDQEDDVEMLEEVPLYKSSQAPKTTE